MGWNNNDNGANRALSARTRTLRKEQIFKERGLRDDMNPFGVTRESRDSANHPDSFAVIVVIDETGSMHDIPLLLSKEELPHLMETLEAMGIQDSQIMFVANGDCTTRQYGRPVEVAPLQVGQFESEGTLMHRWLTGIYLEGAGGGNGGESYGEAIYFAARHTSIDCYEKRGKRGFLFMTGDDNAFSHVSAADIKRLIGDDLKEDMTIEEVIAEAAKMYHIFFLIPDLHRRNYCEGSWRRLLGDAVICMESPEDTSLVAAAIIGLTDGHFKNLDDVAKKLSDLGKTRQQISQVYRAVQPYAASIGRGGKRRKAGKGDLPEGSGRSGNRRL